jgi:hypothetical protein
MKLFEVMFLFESDDLFTNIERDISAPSLKKKKAGLQHELALTTDKKRIAVLRKQVRDIKAQIKEVEGVTNVQKITTQKLPLFFQQDIANTSNPPRLILTDPYCKDPIGNVDALPNPYYRAKGTFYSVKSFKHTNDWLTKVIEQFNDCLIRSNEPLLTTIYRGYHGNMQDQFIDVIVGKNCRVVLECQHHSNNSGFTRFFINGETYLYKQWYDLTDIQKTNALKYKIPSNKIKLFN